MELVLPCLYLNPASELSYRMLGPIFYIVFKTVALAVFALLLGDPALGGEATVSGVGWRLARSFRNRGAVIALSLPRREFMRRVEHPIISLAACALRVAVPKTCARRRSAVCAWWGHAHGAAPDHFRE